MEKLKMHIPGFEVRLKNSLFRSTWVRLEITTSSQCGSAPYMCYLLVCFWVLHQGFKNGKVWRGLQEISPEVYTKVKAPEWIQSEKWVMQMKSCHDHDFKTLNYKCSFGIWEVALSLKFKIQSCPSIDSYTAPCGWSLIALASSCQAQLILSGCFPK